MSFLANGLDKATSACFGLGALAFGVPLPPGTIEAAVGLAGLGGYVAGSRQKLGPECARVRTKTREGIRDGFSRMLKVEGDSWSAHPDLAAADAALAAHLEGCFIDRDALAATIVTPRGFPGAAADLVMAGLAARDEALFGDDAKGGLPYQYARAVVETSLNAALDERAYFEALESRLMKELGKAAGRLLAYAERAEDDHAAMNAKLDQLLVMQGGRGALERELAEQGERLHATRAELLGLLGSVLEQDIPEDRVDAALAEAKSRLDAVRAEIEGYKSLTNETPEIAAPLEAARAALDRGDMIELATAEAALAEAEQLYEASILRRRTEEDRSRAALRETRAELAAARLDRVGAAALYAEAAAIWPEDARERYLAKIEEGQLLTVAGNTAGAAAAYEDATDIARLRFTAVPDDEMRQRDLSVSLERIGDVRAAQGDLPGALAAFDEGLEIRRTLAARDAGNAGWQRDLSVSLNKIGNVRVAQGDLPGALAAFEEGLAIRRTLAAQDAGNAEWQRDLSVSLNKIGDVRRAQGDLPGALAAFAEDLEIARTLAAQDAGNAGWQRDLSVSLDRIGDVRRAQGDLPGSLAAFEEGLVMRRALAAQDAGNAGWQRDLSVSLSKIGDVRVAQGDLPGALAAFEEDLAIARTLAAQDAGNAGWQRDLSVSLERIGDVRVAQGDLPGALAVFEEGMEIARTLAAQDAGNAGWQRDVVVSLWRIAGADAGRAEACWAEAVALLEDMVARGVLAPVDEWILPAAREKLAAARGGG